MALGEAAVYESVGSAKVERLPPAERPVLFRREKFDLSVKFGGSHGPEYSKRV